jgi:hypothetical protein
MGAFPHSGRLAAAVDFQSPASSHRQASTRWSAVHAAAWLLYSLSGDTVMRFLSMVRINENSGLTPSQQLMADMGKLMEELSREGKLIDTAGLTPTAHGTRIRLAGGKLSVMDGPFTEAKEVIGGYALLEADSKEEAIELAKRFLRVHGDEWEVECELRQLMAPEDCCR